MTAELFQVGHYLLCLFRCLRGLPALSVPASVFCGEWTRQSTDLVCGAGQPCHGSCLVLVPAADREWPHLPAESARRDSPTYGLGVNPRFLAEMDPAKNAALLTVGNASPADEGTYYCALWFSGQYVFGEGTRLLYQGESKSVGTW